MVKNTSATAGGTGLILGLGRPPGEGNGNPLQYFWLGNSMDKGAWWATVHRVAKELDMSWLLNNSSNIQVIYFLMIHMYSLCSETNYNSYHQVNTHCQHFIGGVASIWSDSLLTSCGNSQYKDSDLYLGKSWNIYIYIYISSLWICIPFCPGGCYFKVGTMHFVLSIIQQCYV